jgi:hypothetical protein
VVMQLRHTEALARLCSYTYLTIMRNDSKYIYIHVNACMFDVFRQKKLHNELHLQKLPEP